MRLSYIITTYNLQNSHIRRCLTSLTRQGISKEDFEVIVVDDESEKDPEPLVKEFEDRMSIRFFKQSHARQGAARNKAFYEARGEYIQIIDGDDYLFAKSMQYGMEILDRYNLDLLIYSFQETEDRPPIVYCPHGATRIDFYTGHEYMHSNTLFGSSCTMCFRRSLLNLQTDSPLLFPEGIYIEDEDFVTRLVWSTPHLAVTDLIAYAYVRRDGSTTRHTSSEHIEQIFNDAFTVLGRLISFRNDMAKGTEVSGLDRKIRFLAVDILRRALREPDYVDRFASCTERLRTQEIDGAPLFPIPSASYSFKYFLFQRISRYAWGTNILRHYEEWTHHTVQVSRPQFSGTMSHAFYSFRKRCNTLYIPITALSHKIATIINKVYQHVTATISSRFQHTDRNFEPQSPYTNELPTAQPPRIDELHTPQILQSKEGPTPQSPHTSKIPTTQSPHVDERFSPQSQKNDKGIVSYILHAKVNFTLWLQQTGKGFAAWIQYIKENGTPWIQQTKKNISSWIQHVKEDFTPWIQKMKKNISSWYQQTREGFTVWIQHVKKNFTPWIQQTSNDVIDWTQRTTKDAMIWARNIGDYIRQRVTEYIPILISWIQRQIASIRSFIHEHFH